MTWEETMAKRINDRADAIYKHRLEMKALFDEIRVFAETQSQVHWAGNWFHVTKDGWLIFEVQLKEDHIILSTGPAETEKECRSRAEVEDWLVERLASLKSKTLGVTLV